MFPNDGVYISAKYLRGLDDLKERISQIFEEQFICCRLNLDFDKLNDFYKIKEYLESYSMEYKDDCVEINIYLKKIHLSKISKFIK